MGTLTANDVRLPDYCDHKLPTSCRLTSIPECCACADERAHAAAYSTYIDGVGYVQRGTRWQRYCWFCKEFWENRVLESGLRPGQTRIPEVPDQASFLKTWYEFHQGYRIVTNGNGEPERVIVAGEAFRDVPPGHLPRTHEELARGQSRTITRNEQQSNVLSTSDTAQPSLDTTLDDLFSQAVQEDTQTAPRRHSVQAQTMASVNVSARRSAEQEQRRVATLRRELVRMRNGIERVIAGLRELGETVPEHAFASPTLQRLGQSLDDLVSESTSHDASTSLPLTAESATIETTISPLQNRIEEARARVDEAQQMQQQALAELRNNDEEVRSTQRHLQRLLREQWTRDNYVRVFGSREEVQAQGENYESPIGGMFSRAWERFRAAEEVRQEERTLRRVLADEDADGGEDAVRRLEHLQAADRDVWNVPSLDRTETPEPGLTHQDTSNTTQLMEMARDEVFSGQIGARMGERRPGNEAEDALGRYYSMLRRQDGNQTYDASQQQQYPRMMLAEHPLANRGAESAQPVAELDSVPAAYSTAHTSHTSSSSPAYALSTSNVMLDAEFLLRWMDGEENIDDWLPLEEDQQQVYQWTRRIAEGESTLAEMYTIEVLSNEALLWAAGLPSDRSRRARQDQSPLLITEDASSADPHERMQNIEAMAEAFQMSAEVRRSSQCSGPEQLRMLYRLQRGGRSAEDRSVLWRMLSGSASVTVARRVLTDQAFGSSSAESARVADLHHQRRLASRNGQHTRRELQELRESTSPLAIAAGRTAMRAGAQGAMQRLLEMHAEMREDASIVTDRDVAYMESLGPLPRRQINSSSESDNSDEEQELSALDAPNTGRPDAKNDEDMMIKMECKVCFTQVADVACLPCGHLVMCQWCSDQHSPVMMHDKTRPRRPAACPSCRKQIKQKVRVYSV